MKTAAFAVVVVIPVAVAVVELLTAFNVPGSTSNGPPAVPSAAKPAVAVTPENATTEPMAMSARELGKLKVNTLASEPSAMRYKTVPHQASLLLLVP